MYLKDAATIRTGLVISRLTDSTKKTLNCHKLLNLKCIESQGYINTNYAEEIYTPKPPKPDFFTHYGDILIRLNVPYTSVFINRQEWLNYIIPSHFAIIRTNKDVLIPEYTLWFLKKEETIQKIIQNACNTSSFGTISSGFLGSLHIPELPINEQKKIGQLHMLTARELELLNKLSIQKQKYNKLILNKAYNNIIHKEEIK